MTASLDIVGFHEVLARRPGTIRADDAVFLTPEALHTIASTVGSRPPESGAKLFGPSRFGGVDRVEFDERGSASAGSSMYVPDTTWADERIAFWLAQEDSSMRLWTGDVHSHPGGDGFPSLAVGKGLGDLGYAAEVLAAVEWMDAFFMPILTNTGSGRPRLWPWIVSSTAPGIACYADVEVAPVSCFPPRRFNHLWEPSLGVHTPCDVAPEASEARFVHLMQLDLTGVAALVRADIHSALGAVVFRRGDVEVSVTLPDGFPDARPEVHVRGRVGERPFPFAWRPNHPHRAELRLKRLVRAALTFGSQEF